MIVGILVLPLKSLSLNKNMSASTGIDKSIGCKDKDSAKFPFIKVKKALVIPQDIQGMPINLWIKHPVSRNHIATAPTPINKSIASFCQNTTFFIVKLYYCFAPLSNISSTLTLAAKQSARQALLSASGVSNLV